MNRYVMCIARNDEYQQDLVLCRVYQVIPDVKAEEAGLIRLIDATDEDYLYPLAWFVDVELTPAGAAAFEKVRV